MIFGTVLVSDEPRSGHAADRRAVGDGSCASVTTQQYLNPLTEDVIASVLAFHGRQREPGPGSQPAAGYRPESLRVLFGEDAL